MIINRGSDKDDVLFEQARINVVGELATVGLFHHHGDERCAARARIVCRLHRSNLERSEEPGALSSIFQQMLLGPGNSGRATRETYHSGASVSCYRAITALSI